MGNTYWIKIKCDWCGGQNDCVYYEPTSTTFTCEYCKRENHIERSFIAKKYGK